MTRRARSDRADTVIRAADRFKSRGLDREFRNVFRQLPEAVVVAILTAVRDQSEEPLYALPPEWRDRALSVWRREMTASP